eukprot:s1743_g6.t2
MVGQLTVIGCSQEASKDVKVGRWQRPLELLTTTLSHQGLQLDFRAGSLVVKSCSLGRHWVKALKVLHSTRTRCPSAFDVEKAWLGEMSLGCLASSRSVAFEPMLWQRAAAFMEEICGNQLQLLGTTFDAAVGALGSRAWNEALLCLSTACEKGLSRRVIAINSAIRTASSGSFSWPWCVALIDEADIYGWTSAISGCILSSCWERAEEMALQLRVVSLQPGLITSNAIMGARDGETSASPWEVCIQHMHAQCDAVTCSSLSTAGTAARQWDFAIHVLHLMQNRRVLLDGISWSANVAALASGRQWQTSLKVAAKTVSAWDGISSAVGSTILGACSEPWQAAMRVWTWTADANLEPDASDCRSAFLRSLSKNWELSLAFSLGQNEVLKQASAAESIPHLQLGIILGRKYLNQGCPF